MTNRQINLLWNAFWIGVVVFLVGFVLACLAFPAISAYRMSSERSEIYTALRAFPREELVLAIEAFCREKKTRGVPVPESVPLESLVAGGHLAEEVVRDLRWRKETLVSLTEDFENQEGDLLRVRSQSEWIILKADGHCDRRDKSLEAGRSKGWKPIDVPVK